MRFRVWILVLSLLVGFPLYLQAQSASRYLHVFVALCDNDNQGIVPVPRTLGNGQDTEKNLYWGAMYGLRSYFKRSPNWESLGAQKAPGFPVHQRWAFRHRESGAILIADAYDGAQMGDCLTAMLDATAGCGPGLVWENDTLWQPDLVAFVGHNGLMDTELKKNPEDKDTVDIPVVLLCCIANEYFGPGLKRAGGYPLLWTTGLMAPEAYTLEAALDRWLRGGDDLAVRQAAAEAYHRYQKCGVRAAKRLLVTGF